MDSEVTVIRSKKIRVYPTPEQKVTFKKWLGVQRFVYNKTVEYLNGLTGNTPHWMVIAPEIINNLPDFCKEVPYQIKKK
jgi:putative transposase